MKDHCPGPPLGAAPSRAQFSPVADLSLNESDLFVGTSCPDTPGTPLATKRPFRAQAQLCSFPLADDSDLVAGDLTDPSQPETSPPEALH